MDYSLQGSSVHRIYQARILEWLAISFSRGSSQPRDWTWVSCIAGRLLTGWVRREVQKSESDSVLFGSLWLLQARILEWVAFSLLQWIFPTQESNWGLLHCRRILYQLSYEGSPNYTSIFKKRVKLEERASRWHNEQAAHYCQTLVSFQTQSWPLS